MTSKAGLRQHEQGVAGWSRLDRAAQASATFKAADAECSPGDVHVDGPLIARLGSLQGAAEQDVLQPGSVDRWRAAISEQANQERVLIGVHCESTAAFQLSVGQLNITIHLNHHTSGQPTSRPRPPGQQALVEAIGGVGAQEAAVDQRRTARKGKAGRAECPRLGGCG